MKRFKARQACLVFITLILNVFLITGCGGGETSNPVIDKFRSF
jgi:hypothetical protein